MARPHLELHHFKTVQNCSVILNGAQKSIPYFHLRPGLSKIGTKWENMFWNGVKWGGTTGSRPIRNSCIFFCFKILPNVSYWTQPGSLCDRILCFLFPAFLRVSAVSPCDVKWLTCVVFTVQYSGILLLSTFHWPRLISVYFAVSLEVL